MVTHWLKCCIRECFFFFHTVIRQSVQIVGTPAQICQALFFFFDFLFLSFEKDIYPRPPKRAFISLYLLCIKRMQIINIFLKKRISRNQKILKWWSLATLLLPTSATNSVLSSLIPPLHNYQIWVYYALFLCCLFHFSVHKSTSWMLFIFPYELYEFPNFFSKNN